MDERSDLTEQMPATIGRYQVQGCIGYGAMGAVYKAFDPLIKRTLAIKTIRLDIPRQSPQYRSFIERFYHEARISGTLSHPNIVTLFDIGEENGLPYLAMEFVAGETITSYLERGVRFNPERVIVLVSQVASAIDYAHSRTVIHRDIKPSNLILSEGDRVKVTDFGIAKLADADMTQSGTLLGTPSYMSPEQAMGEKLDGRSDIFSLGVCAFEMLSGEQPFPGTNVTSILYKLVHVDPIEPANLEMNGLVPDKWHQVFGKVLAKKPDERYQTASRFVQDLEYCLGSWFGSAMGDDGVAPTVVMRADDSTVALPSPAANGRGPIEVTEAMPVLGDTDTAKHPLVKTPVPPGGGGVTADLKLPALATARPAEDVPATVVMAAGMAPEDKSGTGTAEGDEATVVMAGPSEALEPGPTVLMAPARPSKPAPQSAQAKVKARPASKPLAVAGHARPAGGGKTLLIVGALVVVLGGLTVLGGLVWWLRGRRVSPPPPLTTQGPVATPKQTPVPANGTLSVRSNPEGAAVAINGEPRGVTPFEAVMPLGLYEVQVDLKGFDPRIVNVELTAGRPRADLDLTLGAPTPTSATPVAADTATSAPAPAVAQISSTPTGALVRLDGSEIGKTPLSGIKLAKGEHRVEFSKPGFRDATKQVTVRSGQKAKINAVLETDAPATPTPVVVDTKRVYQERDVDTPPRKLRGDNPDYPKKLKSGERVSITVSFVVNEVGELTDVRVVEAPDGTFDDDGLATLRKWRYEPGTKRGVKVKVQKSLKFIYVKP
jgi:serine/threonine-protein kinase